MKNFLSTQREHPSGTEKRQPGLGESGFPEHHDINITEGGEFLDDLIRMEDQPPIEIALDKGDSGQSVEADKKNQIKNSKK